MLSAVLIQMVGVMILVAGAVGVVIPSSTSSGFRSASQFSAWATSHNIMANKVKLHTFPDGLRGLIALEDIEEGECIMTVPLEMCFVKRGNEEGKWPVALALELLKEMKKGKEGKWWPYLAMLPSVEDLCSCLPIHWGADEIEEGLGENDNVFEDDLNNAIESIWSWRDLMWNNYRYSDPEDEDRGVPQSEIASRQKSPVPTDIIIDDDDDKDSSQAFRVQNRKLISTPQHKSGVTASNQPKADIVTKFLRPEFEHALDLVQTRSCCPEPSLHLIVPFFDLLNHDSSASTSITVDAATQSVRLTTHQRVPKNSQVFLNYHLETQLLSPFLGDQESGKDGSYPMDLSAFTLVSYGFLPAVNEVSLLLPLETIRAALLDARTRVLVESAYEQDGGARNSRPGSALAILQTCGLQIAQPFSVYRDGVSLSLIAVLRVLSATEEERQQLWAAGEKALREEILSGGKVEGFAKQKLLSLLDEELERLQQVLAEQEARGPGLPQRPLKARKQHANMALSIVQDCIEWAQKL